MKNYIQHGDIISVTAPTNGIASGEGLIIGSLFGIALHASVEGDALEIATIGIYQLPKASAAVLTVGARVAWDNTSKQVNTPGTGRFPIGAATEAVGNGITSVTVRLDGVATAAA